RGWRLPASGEVPVGEDDGGVAVEVGPEPGSDGLFPLMGGAVGTERAKGGRVGAALGGEVAAEAEHVCPGRQTQVFKPWEFAEPDAFGDVAAGVLADGKAGELVGGCDAAVEGAGAFSGLGGV